VAGEAVTLSAGGSADVLDGTVTAYEWDLDGDGSLERANGRDPDVGFTPPAAGAPHVTVRGTVTGGASQTARRTLEELPAPRAGAYARVRDRAGNVSAWKTVR